MWLANVPVRGGVDLGDSTELGAELADLKKDAEALNANSTTSVLVLKRCCQTFCPQT